MPDLEVTVGGDISSFLSKIDSAKAKVNQLTESQEQLKVVINDINKSIAINERELTKASVSLQKLNTTTTAGKSAATALRTEIGQLALNSKTLATNLTTAKTQLADTTAQLKTQNIALKEAQTSTGGFASGLTKAYSGLRTLANIIPGIGIGGLVALIAGPLVDAFEKLGDSIIPVLKAQRELDVVLAEAGGSVAGEVVQLNSLIAIAKDTSLSYSARTQAIKELNKEYPELHGNITLENVNTAATVDIINKEIDAIKRRSQAKALEKLIDEESAKLEKVKAEGIKGQINGFESFLDKTADVLGASGLFSNATGQLQSYTNAVAESTTKIDVFSKKLQELNTVAAKEGTLFDPGKTGVAKTAKDIETVAEAMAKINHQIDVIKKNELEFNDDRAKEQLSVLSSGITHLFDKFNLGNENENVIDLKFRINETEERERVRKIGPELQTEIEPLKIPLTITPPKPIEAKEAFIPISKELESLQKEVKDTLKNISVDSLSSIGEALGNALGGGKDPVKGLFDSIFSSVGEQLKSLGKFLIKSGIEIKLAKDAFKKLLANPLASIAIGIGLIALGALIKSQAGNSFKGFATGGLISGPGSTTSDSIVARLSRGEYVIKADTVSRFGTSFFDMLNRGVMPPGFNGGGNIGGGSIGGGFAVAVSGEFELRGNNLVAAVDRSRRTISRNG